MPVNIVRLAPPNISGPSRREGFVNTNTSRLMDQLSLMDSRQEFQGAEAGRDRDLSLLVALLQNKTTQRQLTQQGKQSEDRLGVLQGQLDLSREESRENRKFREAQTEVDNLRNKRLDAEREKQQGRIFSLEEDTLALKERVLEADAAARRDLSENVDFDRWTEQLTIDLNNSITSAALEATGVQTDIQVAARDTDGRIADFASERMHVPESSIRQSLQMFISDPTRNSGEVQNMIDSLQSMVRSATNTITNQSAPIEERMGALSLLIGNSVAPGVDGEPVRLLNALFGYMEQASIVAEENGQSSLVKKIEREIKSTQNILASMEAPAFRAFDEYRTAIQNQPEIDRVNREILDFTVESQRQKDARVSDRLEGRRDQSLANAFGFSAPEPDSSFAGNRPTPVDFNVNDPDVSRALKRLNQIRGPLSPDTTQSSVTEGKKFLASFERGVQSSNRMGQEKAKAAQEQSQIDKKVNRIVEMRAQGKTDQEIAFEVGHPFLNFFKRLSEGPLGSKF